MNPDTSRSPLPLLAVVYGSLSMEQPLHRLAEAAEGVCRILWVSPFGQRDVRSALRLTRARGEISGDVVDASGRSPDEAADLVRAYRPDGITCFIDETIGWTAEIAERLALPFHRPDTAAQLTDKFLQREALRAHGLRTPAYWRAEDLAAPGVLEEALTRVELPVVLKPRRGVAGRDSEPLSTVAAVREAAKGAAEGHMLIEGYIPDPTMRVTGPGSAPFHSVELAVTDGEPVVLGVTGRTPLAPPFRETGQIFPADVDAPVREGLVAAAVEAARALAITHGVLHVEIKSTDDGPVVIEVNGRPGGGLVHEFVEQVTGTSPLRLAMMIALGQGLGAGRRWRAPTDVGFVFWIQPDLTLHRIDAVSGLDRVRAIPGVSRVTAGVGAGSEVTWRVGYLGFVAEVAGRGADHDHVRRIREQVLSTIRIDGE